MRFLSLRQQSRSPALRRWLSSPCLVPPASTEFLRCQRNASGPGRPCIDSQHLLHVNGHRPTPCRSRHWHHGQGTNLNVNTIGRPGLSVVLVSPVFWCWFACRALIFLSQLPTTIHVAGLYRQQCDPDRYESSERQYRPRRRRRIYAVAFLTAAATSAPVHTNICRPATS